MTEQGHFLFLKKMQKELIAVYDWLQDCDFVMADHHLDWVIHKFNEHIEKHGVDTDTNSDNE